MTTTTPDPATLAAQAMAEAVGCTWTGPADTALIVAEIAHQRAALQQTRVDHAMALQAHFDLYTAACRVVGTARIVQAGSVAGWTALLASVAALSQAMKQTSAVIIQRDTQEPTP